MTPCVRCGTTVFATPAFTLGALTLCAGCGHEMIGPSSDVSMIDFARRAVAQAVDEELAYTLNCDLCGERITRSTPEEVLVVTRDAGWRRFGSDTDVCGGCVALFNGKMGELLDKITNSAHARAEKIRAALVLAEARLTRTGVGACGCICDCPVIDGHGPGCPIMEALS